jgi:alkylation response protein AidB-like acyl-CoA dehydrogenase
VDFGDTPGDAAFRAECRAWLAAHAQPRRGTYGMGSLTDGDPETERRHVAAAQAWQAVLADAGWAGIAWPVEHGGRGGTPRQQAIFDEEQAAFDVPSSVFVQGIGMAGPTIIAHGTDAQRDRFLRPMLRGEEIWCQLFSEPGAGSDLASLATRAVPDPGGDGFVVDGQKVWTSSAQFSDWGILLARTNRDVPKHRGITYFVVDMRSPGIEVRPLRQITGVAHFNEVFLTGVRVPAANVIGEVDGGWAVAMTTLTAERSAIGGGRAHDVVGELVDLLRASPGAAGDPVLRQQVTRAWTHDRILTYLGWRARTAVDRGEPPGAETSVIKLAHSLHQAELGDLGLAVLGARGLALDYGELEASPWQVRFLAQWASRIGGGTEQVQRNIVAERILGLPREPRPDKDLPFREAAHSPG